MGPGTHIFMIQWVPRKIYWYLAQKCSEFCTLKITIIFCVVDKGEDINIIFSVKKCSIFISINIVLMIISCQFSSEVRSWFLAILSLVALLSSAHSLCFIFYLQLCVTLCVYTWILFPWNTTAFHFSKYNKYNEIQQIQPPSIYRNGKLFQGLKSNLFNYLPGMLKPGKNKESEEATALLLDMPGVKHVVPPSFMSTHRCIFSNF